MDRTSKSAHTVMMQHVADGDVPACIVVIDPEDGEQSVLVSAFEYPRELGDQVDSIAVAILAIKHAHARALELGMDPVY